MNRGFVTLAGIAALLVAVLAFGATGLAKKKDADPSTFRGSEKLRKALTVDGITEHLEELQAISDANGGNRAAGFPGFDASADYVADTLDDAGWEVTRQPFDFFVFFQDEPSEFDQVSPDPQTYVEPDDFITMDFSGSGEVTSSLVSVDLVIPPGAEPSTSNSGCEAGDFAGFPAGSVALMQRGTCTFRTKVDNATAAGAGAAVIFNEGQPGRQETLAGTLAGPNADIPAVGISFALGEELANGVNNGDTGRVVHVKTTTHDEFRSAENVLAETPTGDPDNLVMAGAHLDSVQDGPGINDNGSGSATLLELAEQISKKHLKPANKLRFAWWGAEEEGLVGSTEYVNQLTDEEGAAIAGYLNFDMIGSPNYVRFIYDGNGSKFGTPGPAGSDAIEREFERYFSAAGLASGQTAFDGRSDYGPFIAVGIPAGGLFTGAEGVKTEAQQAVYGGTEGEAYDACYHSACDDITNINSQGLDEMSDAVAHTVNHFAFSLSGIPRPESAAKVKTKRKAVKTKYLGDLLRK